MRSAVSTGPMSIRDDTILFGGIMQNIVIDKPYVFVPPHRGTFWPAVFRPGIRPYLSKVHGLTGIEFVGVGPLSDAVRDLRQYRARPEPLPAE